MDHDRIAQNNNTLQAVTPMSGRLLQRKCACGQHTPGGGQCAGCAEKKKLKQPLQAKLQIGEANDSYEQEADRVADQVMRISKPSVGNATDYLQAKPLVQRQVSNTQHGVNEVPSIVHDVLRSPGQPLDQAARDFMEPRFDHDLSKVKIHTDAKASGSTRSVNALAYTVGNHIVFRSGHYDSLSSRGRKLLAHELTHTIQQSDSYFSPKKLSIGKKNSPLEKNADVNADQVMSINTNPINIINSLPHLQKTCGSAAIGSVSGCIGMGGQDVSDFGLNSNDIYKFEQGCDDFRLGEGARLERFSETISPDATVEIHGFASEEGDIEFNDNLSCARAKVAATKFSSAFSTEIALFNHGATPGPHEDRRSVVISVLSESERSEIPSESEEVCADYINNCQFYLCRDRKYPCGSRGYYQGYGHKYCQRFSQQARPQMTTAGREWIDCTLRCLQVHIGNNIPENTPCDEVRRSAFDSHAGCYVQCGVCSLSPGDHTRLLDTIDSEDIDYSQVLETVVGCGFLLFPPSPPSSSGFQGECVMRLGGCSQTRPAGVPSEEEIAQYNSQCRADTGYTGDDVIPNAEDCERYFGQ
ncbi:MAG: eCIS core domain-containing protein [Marinobacter sp.]